ncbi:MAG: baseplate J/gp47 family protein [Anaerolineales bacterium]
MKVHIINLDPEDDHASARDKISWARAPKVVLAWPRRGKPLGRRLDLAVVQRHASRLGLELGLVTFDPEVIAHAEQLNIPVFDSLEKLPPGTWTEPPGSAIPSPERRSIAELREAREADSFLQLGERGRLIAVAISAVAMLAIAISVLPSAEIVVDPVGIPMEESLSIWIDPLPSPASSRVPGQTVSAEISGAKRIDTTGRVRLPRATASGEVEITNLTGEEVSVPAGTGLRAGEIRFLTSDEVLLEAGEGSSATVPIEANEAGLSGNVAAGAIDSVEGALGFLISASNPEPTRGGRDQVAAAVSVRDMEDLRQELESELIEIAESALPAQLDRGFELVPGSLRITEAVDEHYDVRLGEAAESLGLSLTLKIEGLGYSVQLVREAAEQEILSALPANRLLIPGSLSLEAIDASADWPAMEAIFMVEGSLAKTIDRDLLRRSVLGDPKAQAAARLEDLLELDQAPMIQTSPTWMPWVPWLGIRIDVKWAWESA